MDSNFFALISRMRYIERWSLMRNSIHENIQEHSHMVAVLAHGLAMIQRDILGEPADPDRLRHRLRPRGLRRRCAVSRCKRDTHRRSAHADKISR